MKPTKTFNSKLRAITKGVFFLRNSRQGRLVGQALDTIGLKLARAQKTGDQSIRVLAPPVGVRLKNLIRKTCVSNGYPARYHGDFLVVNLYEYGETR